MSRRTALLTVALVVLAVGLVALGVRFGIGSAGTIDTVATGSVADEAVPQEATGPPTGEDLIAGALAAGDISYEDSLRARACALFNDPRLEPAFRSAVIPAASRTACRRSRATFSWGTRPLVPPPDADVVQHLARHQPRHPLRISRV
jgi:hypothetical protein